MTKQELKDFILRSSGKYDMKTLILVSGETAETVGEVINEYGLSGHVVNNFDLCIKELISNPNVYTIGEISKKFCLNYKTLWQRLSESGLKHLCINGNSKSSYSMRYEIMRLYEQEKGSISKVSEIARRRKLIPCSRQGIYNILKEEGVL